MSMYIITVAYLILFASGTTFIRHILLLSESRQDHENTGTIPGASTDMTRFFIRANYIHLAKMVVIFLATAVILMDEYPGPPDAPLPRLETTTTAIFFVVSLATILGQMEARARRSLRRFYRDGVETVGRDTNERVREMQSRGQADALLEQADRDEGREHRGQE